MSQSQAQAFESWFRYELSDGAEWFNVQLRTPIGLQSYECRFADMYSGPQLVGVDRWVFQAMLEIRERQTLADGYELVPSIVLYSDIFDRAMNQEWPA